MSDTRHFNENIQHNIEALSIADGAIRLTGWLFAELEVVRIDVLATGAFTCCYPLASFGLDSPDVAGLHGAKAGRCRFHEQIALAPTQGPVTAVALVLSFASGLARTVTIKPGPASASWPLRAPARPALRLGIGVTTFRRRASLQHLLEKLRRHTETPFELIVADDGSQDDTVPLLAGLRIAHLTGSNRGVAWNKNRALYYLNSVRACDVIILLEDDTHPSCDGWEKDWIAGAQRWGHVNLAGSWFQDGFVSGRGTADDPISSLRSSGQCVSFARRVVERVGYFDSRFGRYGFEHIEHSERCIRLGYGGVQGVAGQSDTLFYLIRGGLTVGHMGDLLHTSHIADNAPVYDLVRDDEVHRWAWRGDAQMRDFLAEQDRVTTF